MRIFQKGFNYSQDGPGNRLVYHLQGCNFKCRWCSNPEGMGSICEKTKEYTPEEICREAARSKAMFFDGGGVTFTGGEATLQFEELKKTLMLLKNQGINTAIETNGSNPRLDEIVPYTDFLMMDIKHISEEKHREYTEAGNEITLHNYEKLCGSAEMHIRIPLINHFNNGCGKEFADYFGRFDNGKNDFEILPYHEYGKCKYKTEYPMKDGFVSESDIGDFTEALVKAGLRITHS